MTLGIVLLQGPRRGVFLMSEVPLYQKSLPAFPLSSKLGTFKTVVSGIRTRLEPFSGKIPPKGVPSSLDSCAPVERVGMHTAAKHPVSVASTDARIRRVIASETCVATNPAAISLKFKVAMGSNLTPKRS